MDPAIMTALIGAGGSIIGAAIGVIASAKLTSFRLEQLELKVDKHNQLIERTYILERDIEVLKNREKVSEHRIDDLEHKE